VNLADEFFIRQIINKDRRRGIFQPECGAWMTYLRRVGGDVGWLEYAYN
jgi:hypothetical protein